MAAGGRSGGGGGLGWEAERGGGGAVLVLRDVAHALVARGGTRRASEGATVAIRIE